MKKTTVWTLILLLPALATLAGLTALPAVCHAQEELSLVMSLDKEGIIQAGDSVTVTLIPSGGHPPYQYYYTMVIYDQGNAHSYQFDPYNAGSSYTWPVGFGDRVVLTGGVLDKFASRADCEASLEIQGSVYNPLTVTGISFGPSRSVNLGDTITCSVSAKGGQPPYTYDYKLWLVQDDCYYEPYSGGSHSSDSFSYPITRGTEGSIYCIVQDVLGRKATSETVDFTIHGDERGPMNFRVTQDMGKLSKNNYRITIQASATGGTQPVRFYCWWYPYKDGAVTDSIVEVNKDGAFSLEGDFDKATAFLIATDDDDWSSKDYYNLTFNTRDAARPILSDVIIIDPLREALDIDGMIVPNWQERAKRLLDALEEDSSGDPDVITVTPILNDQERVRTDLATPRLVRPEMTRAPVTATPEPEKTKPPETTGPEIVKPDLLNPDLTKPQLPPQLPPNLPKR